MIPIASIERTARALSHSVQSMERYHEEYHATHDKHEAMKLVSLATIPSGAENPWTFLYSRCLCALVMNVAQIGRALCAPSSLKS